MRNARVLFVTLPLSLTALAASWLSQPMSTSAPAANLEPLEIQITEPIKPPEPTVTVWPDEIGFDSIATNRWVTSPPVTAEFDEDRDGDGLVDGVEDPVVNIEGARCVHESLLEFGRSTIDNLATHLRQAHMIDDRINGRWLCTIPPEPTPTSERLKCDAHNCDLCNKLMGHLGAECQPSEPPPVKPPEPTQAPERLRQLEMTSEQRIYIFITPNDMFYGDETPDQLMLADPCGLDSVECSK